MKDITTEEAVKMLDKFITEHKFYNIKQSDGLEDNIEKVLNELKKYDEGKIVSVKLIKKFYLISRDEKNQKSIADVTFFEKYAPKEILEKKDKIINAMAELIEECRQNNCLESEDVDLSQIAGVEAIKQYFERKVADERRNDQKINRECTKRIRDSRL